MNYRHAYHAGNFADVVKHVVLVRLIEYLKRKDKPFRVIDTHAGIGLYDLSSAEAQKTGEWRDGIGRLTGVDPGMQASVLLAPYLEAVASCNADGGIRFYPGSPWLARRLLRKQDRLTAIELHPQDVVRLKEQFQGDFQTRIIELDGWLALGAHLPPKEKRGLVLIDPPFEQEGEFDRLVAGVEKAHKRWPGGIYALWYPIKDRRSVADFRSRLALSGMSKVLDIVFEALPGSNGDRLDGTGMVVVNPPFTLEQELRSILPALRSAMAEPGAAGWQLDWLVREDEAGV